MKFEDMSWNELVKVAREMNEQIEAIGGGGVKGKLMPGAAPVSAEQAALAADFGQAESRMNTGVAQQNADHFGQVGGSEVAAPVSAEPVGYVSKQAIERFQDGRHADIYPSIEELTHEFFDATPMALYAAPIATQAHPTPTVPAETLRVCGVIADKIEDGSLFQSGIYRNSELAGFVRQVLRSVSAAQAQPIMPPLTDAMRAVIRNEHDVYGNEDALYAALCAAAQAQPLPDSLVPTAPDLEYLRSMADSTNLPAFLRGQIAAAVKELATKAQPKRRPYNPSGSLSEYGVFPECDAQQPVSGADQFRDAAQMIEQAGALTGQNQPETRKDTALEGGAQPSGNAKHVDDINVADIGQAVERKGEPSGKLHRPTFPALDDDGRPIGYADWHNRRFKGQPADAHRDNNCQSAWSHGYRAALDQRDASKSKHTIIVGPGRVKSFGKITMGEDGWLVFEGFSIDGEGSDDPRLAICNAALKEIAKQKDWMLQNSQGCAAQAQQDAETGKSVSVENQGIADGYGYYEGDNPPNSLLYQCMAPFHLNLCRGHELQSVIDYGRLVWKQARTKQDADKADAERYIFLRDYACESWEGWVDQPNEERSDQEIDEAISSLKADGRWAGSKRGAE